MNAIDLLVDVPDAYGIVLDTREALWRDWLRECDRRIASSVGLRPLMLGQSHAMLAERAKGADDETSG